MVSDVRGPERKARLKAAPPMPKARAGGVSIAAQSIVNAEPASMARELVGHVPNHLNFEYTSGQEACKENGVGRGA